METPNLEYVTCLPLAHNGDCSLLGVAADLTVYAEEIYSEDGWIAQHALRLDGSALAQVDEDYGQNTAVKPIALPGDVTKPTTGWHTMALNFTGARHRGLRSLERVGELIYTVSIEDKMILTTRINVPPPLILGLGESYVLAEAQLAAPHLFLVCRRLRVIYALETEQTDEQEQQPYDYDSQVLYAAHLYDRSQDVRPTLRESLAGLPGIQLRRPMDLLVAQDHIFVADGGEGERMSMAHVWRIKKSN